MCSFSIHSEICQIETVAMNNEIAVTLRRTLSYMYIHSIPYLMYMYMIDILFTGPQANITPVYSTGSPSTLTKVIITIHPEVGVQLQFV